MKRRRHIAWRLQKVLDRLVKLQPPGTPDRARAERAKEESFGPITDDTRAEDRQRLADAVAGKGRLI